MRRHDNRNRDHHTRDGQGMKLNKIIPNKLSKVSIASKPIKISNKIKPYNIEGFVKLKTALNEKKSEMDVFYLDKTKGESFGQMVNALRITNQLRYDMEHDFNGQHVTRAWLKFYELFVHFDFVGRILRTHNAPAHPQLKIFFNAELPGAGICAINHLMKTHYSNVDYTWVANSLVLGDSVDERINALGDQYGIWEHNKDNWLMNVGDESGGYMNDGDVTKLDNILDMKRKIGNNKPNIVTHDAGIDVSYVVEDLDEQTGFNTQEYKNMKIHFGCAVAAFETLADQGIFMAKQYTFFETFTTNLILIYASMFEEFYVCKPLTSGHSNSEIYLVGIGFKGFPDKYRKIFHERMINWNVNPFTPADNVPQDASAELERYCRLRNTEQIQYINENIKIFNDSRGNVFTVKNYMRDIQRKFSTDWIRMYQPRRITDSDKVADSASSGN